MLFNLQEVEQKKQNLLWSNRTAKEYAVYVYFSR